MDNESENKNPFQSSDISADIYLEINRQLMQMGFSKSTVNSSVFTEILQKNTPRGTIKINMYFLPTSFYGGTEFQKLYKKALEEGSVVIYDGHSGLGEYLNIDKIEKKNNFKINFPTQKYQIYFFNSCSSYPYYNATYFDRKLGTKNLDIITNGLATLFIAIEPSTMPLLKAIDQYMQTGIKTSYQSIISKSDSENLIGINGDEDNAR